MSYDSTRSRLVLGRKVGQSIAIGLDTEVFVLSVRGKTVRLGIIAPRETSIIRTEIVARIAVEEESRP